MTKARAARGVVPKVRAARAAREVVPKVRAARARCYRSPMAQRTACGKTGGADSERWSDTQCPQCLAKQPDMALTYARYCGTEFEANLDNSRMRDYFDDCALQWGFVDWVTLPNDRQLLVRKAFDAGRAARKSQ